jgi:hypothetical protein
MNTTWLHHNIKINIVENIFYCGNSHDTPKWV